MKVKSGTGSHLADLEKRLAQLNTKAERQKLTELLLDAIDSTVVVTDPNLEDNPIIYVNRHFQRLTGYSYEEAVGQNCRFLQREDRDQPGVQQLREAIKAGRGAQVELRNYRKDGTMFWNELYVTPIKNEAGEVILFVGVQNDISQRKALEAETQRYAAALKQANDAVLITGAELEFPGPEILYANEAFHEMTGYTLDEIKGANPRLLQGEKTSRVVLDRMRAALEAGRTFSGETVNYRKNGEEYILDWNVAPVLDEEGKQTHWISVQRDVTERRRLERRLLGAWPPTCTTRSSSTCSPPVYFSKTPRAIWAPTTG